MLGGLWLEHPLATADGRGIQRQRLALLSVVWLSPNRRVTRDKVLALLWPESTATEGRHRLSTALYDVRRALGGDVVRSSGDELWVPPSVDLDCDVDQFERAVATSDFETATASYRGPLLDGVHLPRLYEFDEWITGHRERLRRVYAGTLEHLIDSRQLAGDHVGAVDAARQLSEVEPLSERVALVSANAMSKTGDRADAVGLLERYVTRIDREVGVPPPPAVAQMLRQLRAMVHEPHVPEHTAADPAPSVAMPLSGRVSGARWFTRGRAHTTTLAAALVLMVGGMAYARRVAVQHDGVSVELRNAAEPSLSTAAAESVQQQLAAALAATGACADGGVLARAGGAGGRCRVTGQISVRGTGLILSVMLEAGRTGASLSSADAVVHRDSVGVAATALARDLVAGAMVGLGNDFAAAAVRSTASAAAMHAFLLGDAQYRRGYFPAARASLETAVAADSAFALAHYRLSQTLLWEDAPASLAGRHDSLAMRYINTVPANEQTLIRAYGAWRLGEASRAESLYRVVLTRNPRYAEARFQLGETRFHYNALQGRSIDEASGEFDWVIDLDSTHWGARWHRALLDAAHVPPATLRAHIDALLAGHSEGFIAEEMRLFAADTGPVLARLSGQANATVLFDAAWRRAVFRGDLDGAEVLLLTMSRGDRPRFDQFKAAYLVGALRLGRGRVRDALPLLPLRRPDAHASEALLIATTAVLAGELHEGLADRDSLFAVVSEWQRTLRAAALQSDERRVTAEYLLGILAAARGKDASARLHAATLDSMDADAFTPHRLAEVIRAVSAYHDGHCDEVLRYLDRSTTAVWLGVVASSAGASSGYERFLRADCLAQQGRHQEAIAWFQTLEHNTLYDLAMLRPALRGQARSYRALGDRRSADDIERRIAAW